jgi:hypothetical protein
VTIPKSQVRVADHRKTIIVLLAALSATGWGMAIGHL